jgi:Xaa-Pro aminopeptidase
MPNRPYQDLVAALKDYELVDFAGALAGVRSRIRPREITATRIALGIAEKAALAADRLFADGASNAAAVIEAERVARLEGAWDFRALANLNSDDLRPYERPSDDRRPLLLWVATRYQGYWADRVVDSAGGPESEAARAVAAMVSATRAGATAGMVADVGLAVLSEVSRRSALSYGLGHGIGIELNGTPKIAPKSEAKFLEGGLLSFRIFARGGKEPSFASALVRIEADGAVPLEPLSR